MNKVKTLSDLNKKELLQFYRHWKWADMVKDQHLKSDFKRGPNILSDPQDGFLCIWYGLLYVLIDFMKSKKLHIPTIAKEIRKVREPLRDFRNAVFHIDEDVLSEKYFITLRHPELSYDILKIHSEIERHIQEEVNRRIAKIPLKLRNLELRSLKEITSLKEFDPIPFLMEVSIP